MNKVYGNWFDWMDKHIEGDLITSFMNWVVKAKPSKEAFDETILQCNSSCPITGTVKDSKAPHQYAGRLVNKLLCTCPPSTKAKLPAWLK